MNPLYEDLGFYMPAFFYMKLEFPYYATLLSLYNLKPENQATFVHEYIHYLQDLSTIFGINNAYVYSEYMHGAVNKIYTDPNNEARLPVRIYGNYGNIELNWEVNSACTGDYDEIDMLFLLDIEEKKKRTIYRCSYINKLTHIYLLLPGGKRIQFGGRAIMESMAYMIEKCVEPRCKGAKDYPYHAAECVAKKIYPEFADDVYRMIALCDMSLNTSNPGKIFVQTLKIYKKRKQLPTAEQIYADFYNSPCEMMGNMTYFLPAFMNFAMNAAERLVKYLNHEEFYQFHNAVRKMIGGAIELRMKQPMFMVDIAKGGDLYHNDVLRRIMHRLGSPVIKDITGNFSQVPSRYFNDDQFRYFVAIEQVFNTLHKGCDCCDMIDWCDYPNEKGKKEVQIDERCFMAPWERVHDDRLCPYAVLWKNWNLANKKVINQNAIAVV